MHAQMYASDIVEFTINEVCVSTSVNKINFKIIWFIFKYFLI